MYPPLFSLNNLVDVPSTRTDPQEMYPLLFSINNPSRCTLYLYHKGCTLQCVKTKFSGGFKGAWRRPLFNNEITMAVNFLKDVERSVIQQNGRDAWVWMADPSGSYSVQSAYKVMRGPIVDGIKDRAFEELWQLKIPTKYAVFAWRLLRDRLPTRINLHRRQIDILDRHCPFCSREEEEAGHLFFHCNTIIRIWWESLSWVNKSAAFPKDPRQHFLQHGDILNEGRRATSAEVLEEAQHLWHLGENIGMEAATTNSDILHNYASMECRDRKEAMEVDDIPCVGKPLMIGYGLLVCKSAYGMGGYALKCKLQNLKHRLKTWSRDNCGDSGSKVKQTQKKLNDLENSLIAHPSDQQVQELKRTQADLWEQSFLHESIVRQKSRSKWIIEGDGNTSYFHKIINFSRRRNAILQHFQGRFAEPSLNRANLDGVSFNVLSINQRDMMVEPFKEAKLAPSAVIKRLTAIQRQFLWGGNLEGKKIAWIAWNQVCAPREKGGLGIKDMKAFNRALLIKWKWLMFHQQHHLWSRILTSKYRGWRGLEEGPPKQIFSSSWSDLRSIIHHSSMVAVNKQFRWKLGSGDQILFWEDSWVGDGITLKDRYPELYQISSQKLKTVASMGIFGESGWEWKFSWRRYLFDNELGGASAFID
ncbi:putative ribonuclease H protein [Glycine soja]